MVIIQPQEMALRRSPDPEWNSCRLWRDFGECRWPRGGEGQSQWTHGFEGSLLQAADAIPEVSAETDCFDDVVWRNIAQPFSYGGFCEICHKITEGYAPFFGCVCSEKQAAQSAKDFSRVCCEKRTWRTALQCYKSTAWNVHCVECPKLLSMKVANVQSEVLVRRRTCFPSSVSVDVDGSNDAKCMILCPFWLCLKIGFTHEYWIQSTAHMTLLIAIMMLDSCKVHQSSPWPR